MNKHINTFDTAKALKLWRKYPKLKVALGAGLISRRLCASILGISKYEMSDLYIDLTKAGAIKILSTSAFRASPEMLNLLNNNKNEIKD